MTVSVQTSDGWVRVTTADWEWAGRVLDLRETVTVDQIRSATDAWIVSEKPPPLTASLVEAARSWGLSPPQADRIATLEAQLAAAEETDTPDLAAIRREVAESGTEIGRLRERAATLRGRLEAQEQPDEQLQSALTETMRTLTEAETERLAAQQRLERARKRVREARDRRERRLRLRDELHNRRREARRALVERLYQPFAAAVRQLPGDADPGTTPDDYSGSPVTARLGTIAVAAGDRPAVLAVDPFSDLTAAARRLAAPVVRVAPS